MTTKTTAKKRSSRTIEPVVAEAKPTRRTRRRSEESISESPSLEEVGENKTPEKTEAKAEAPVRRGRPRKTEAEKSVAPKKAPKAKKEEIAEIPEPTEKKRTRTSPKSAQRDLKCITVNVPKPILDEIQLHAERRFDTMTTIVREALLDYLRTHELPKEINFIASDLKVDGQ